MRDEDCGLGLSVGLATELAGDSRLPLSEPGIKVEFVISLAVC